MLLPEEDNIYGCKNLTPPESALTTKIVWLVKRGVCTYSKKAFISQQSGAYSVLVYHNDAFVDISTVIPCADSIYNNVEIPIILISNKNGEELKDRISSFNDVLINIDIDTPGELAAVV